MVRGVPKGAVLLGEIEYRKSVQVITGVIVNVPAGTELLAV
jgi:hypothetical protein